MVGKGNCVPSGGQQLLCATSAPPPELAVTTCPCGAREAGEAVTVVMPCPACPACTACAVAISWPLACVVATEWELCPADVAW
jgi:hypothetical protein